MALCAGEGGNQTHACSQSQQPFGLRRNICHTVCHMKEKVKIQWRGQKNWAVSFAVPNVSQQCFWISTTQTRTFGVCSFKCDSVNNKNKVKKKKLKTVSRDELLATTSPDHWLERRIKGVKSHEDAQSSPYFYEIFVLPPHNWTAAPADARPASLTALLCCPPGPLFLKCHFNVAIPLGLPVLLTCSHFTYTPWTISPIPIASVALSVADGSKIKSKRTSNKK